MKRPHRSIETFDISLMAVVTKAMGAFLVLMLLLIPYYSSSPLGKDEAEDLTKKVKDADAKIKGVLDKLGDKELGKDLSFAREQLGSGEQLIGQLKRFVDQLSSQVTRLEDKITTLSAELDQLKKDKTTLTARVSALEKENAELKAENEKLKAKLAELEKTIEALNKRIAELEKSEPEKVEELKKKIEALEKEVAALKQQNADLNARVASLESENAGLKERNAALEQQMAQLNAMVVPLQQENGQLKAKIAGLEEIVAPLQQENTQLKAEIAELESRLKDWQQNSSIYIAQPALAGDAQSSDCKNFSVGAFSDGMTVGNPPEHYVLNFSDGFGSTFAGRSYAGKYISTFVYSGSSAARYYLLLLSRSEPPPAPPADTNIPVAPTVEDGGGNSADRKGSKGGSEAAPPGGTAEKAMGRMPPLQPPANTCTVVVSTIFSASRHGYSSFSKVVLKPGEPIQYFGDAVVRDDWSVDFVGPSEEGKAWLKDQLAHAEVLGPGASPAVNPSAIQGRVVPPGFTRGDRVAPDGGTAPPGFGSQRTLPGGQPLPGTLGGRAR